MASVPDWDRYFLEICRVVAVRSKDPSTKVGCVIVGPAHEIRSTGYNSLPRHIRDDKPERFERPAKYLWIEHAERNAIYNAARAGTPLEGCSLYADLMPCMDCARAIVQAGIVEVVVDETRYQQYSGPMYSEQFAKVLELFGEAGVRIRTVPTGVGRPAPAEEPAK
ncbi:MAG: dCMP deaminase family protein [Bryobacteraceae bacterium]|jgi:dCMP deaminase|nr:dCMP deaminase family protein [Bryobacteraceae bacterium]